ncbi:toxin-antitoxin system YwqK family antitoxin [Novosphingobium mangrovi (ex Hu et al. 2023)]|uniref:MORN repeat variant n=1 Tax=Novosphingobium mangrovi (ex Hu et al. 2023) TaxID=2930094 RepID=A0ABT0A7W6_9SPHN|nr:hypothetical protein [Novosphingobium mangrovi (ex Hu et al. 2023)]MCJ1959284.1 hypothetical protein [Novosphingobium mangrovi (ex Hu et al. 2023)]
MSLHIHGSLPLIAAALVVAPAHGAPSEAVEKPYQRDYSEAELCAVSQRDAFTGILDLRAADGTLRRRVECRDGRKDGLDRQFYPTGVLAVERSWSEGALDGPYRHWSDEGTLLERWTYGPSGLEGDYYVFHENGQLASKAHWREGKRDGPYINYARDGRLKEYGNYRKGRADGDQVEYRASGAVGHKHYAMGRPVGPQPLWSKDGTLLALAEYDEAGRFLRGAAYNLDGSMRRESHPLDIPGHGRGLETTEYNGCETRTVIQSGTDDPRRLAEMGYSLAPGVYRLETIHRCGKLVERVEAFDHELLTPAFHAEPPDDCP